MVGRNYKRYASNCGSCFKFVDDSMYKTIWYIKKCCFLWFILCKYTCCTQLKVSHVTIFNYMWHV